MKNDLVKRKTSFVGSALFAVVSMFVITSCSDDDEGLYVYRPANYVSMGMVNNEGYIETDKGNVLIPHESSVERELTEGERVFLRCNILGGSNENTFQVHINKYYPLLTKDFVRSSQINENELGENPIHVERSWFGGGYLNLCLTLKHNPFSDIKHSINLVYDETSSTADTARFVLFHNANGDTEKTVIGHANTSFPVHSLLSEGHSKVYVVLKWHWYNRKRLRDGVLFLFCVALIFALLNQIILLCTHYPFSLKLWKTISSIYAKIFPFMYPFPVSFVLTMFVMLA